MSGETTGGIPEDWNTADTQTLEELVYQCMPGYATALQSIPIYQFGGRSFYQKEDPYSDEPYPSVPASGASSDGWKYK